MPGEIFRKGDGCSISRNRVLFDIDGNNTQGIVMLLPITIIETLLKLFKDKKSSMGIAVTAIALMYTTLTLLATKDELAELRIELRIKDIEASLYIYNQQDLSKLDNFSRQYYEGLRESLKDYEKQRIKIQGLSDE